MDEPSWLDELTAKNLEEAGAEHLAESSFTDEHVIMVSHNVEEAVFMADRIIVMSSRPGKIVGEIKVNICTPILNT